MSVGGAGSQIAAPDGGEPESDAAACCVIISLAAAAAAAAAAAVAVVQPMCNACNLILISNFHSGAAILYFDS